MGPAGLSGPAHPQAEKRSRREVIFYVRWSGRGSSLWPQTARGWCRRQALESPFREQSSTPRVCLRGRGRRARVRMKGAILIVGRPSRRSTSRPYGAVRICPGVTAASAARERGHIQTHAALPPADLITACRVRHGLDLDWARSPPRDGRPLNGQGRGRPCRQAGCAPACAQHAGLVVENEPARREDFIDRSTAAARGGQR